MKTEELKSLVDSLNEVPSGVKWCSILDTVRYDDIQVALEVKELQTHMKMDWLDHILLIRLNKMPRKMVEYAPRGNRNVGRPGLRWESWEQAEMHKLGKAIDDDDNVCSITEKILLNEECNLKLFCR